MKKHMFIFLLSIALFFESKSQNYYSDDSIISYFRTLDSSKDLLNLIISYSRYWREDSNTNYGYRLLYSLVLKEKIPNNKIRFEYLKNALGRPFEIKKFDDNKIIYSYLIEGDLKHLNKNRDYFQLFCFLIDIKSDIICKTYFEETEN